MTEQQQQDKQYTETIAAQLRNELALRRVCEQVRIEREADLRFSAGFLRESK